MNKKIKLEIIEKITSLIIAGLGLVAALAWNDAIQKLFKYIFGEQSSLVAMFAYAIFITIIVVLLTIHLSKISRYLKEEENDEKK